MYVYIYIYIYIYIYTYIYAHGSYACICVCIYGVYIWMYIFRHCVYKRAFILFWSYDHVHIEKEKKKFWKIKKVYQTNCFKFAEMLWI